MNILPRVHFYASMLHLPPITGFWEKIQGWISKFIWKNQKPRIKNRILQYDKKSGGLGVLNVELSYVSFMLRPLIRWLDQDSDVPWAELEKQIILPYNCKDIIFSDLSNTYCRIHFGPLVTHSVYIWQTAVKMGQWETKWHIDTPISSGITY